MTMSDSVNNGNYGNGMGSKSREKRNSRKVFIGMHFGAGEHFSRKEDTYMKLSDAACKKGLKVLNSGGSADEAIVQALIVLENSKKLNAGNGSHLTMHETVECDAGFMSGSGRFGGVGAISGVPNPCLVAKALANLVPDPLIPPNLLVGLAAKSWASTIGIKTCSDTDLICKRARRVYNRFIEEKEEAMSLTESDTIGVIALDCNGHVSAGGSTGGGLYKMPGRVGPIAQFGSGVYACDATEESPLATAIAATGTGEFLTELRFAATCDDFIRTDEFHDPIPGITKLMETKIIGKKVMNSPTKSPIVGMIGLTWAGSRGEFIISHNSDAMVCAYTGSAFKSKTQMKFSSKSESRNYSLQVFTI